MRRSAGVKCETSLRVGVGARTNASRPASIATDQVVTRVIISTENRHLVVMATNPRVGWTRNVGTTQHYTYQSAATALTTHHLSE